MRNSIRSRDLARTTNRYTDTRKREAFEKSRVKTEDVLARGFASTVLVAIVGIFRKLARFFGFGGRAKYHVRATSKLWHRLTVGHTGAAKLCTRKERQYAKRGYGYVTPPEAKKEAAT